MRLSCQAKSTRLTRHEVINTEEVESPGVSSLEDKTAQHLKKLLINNTIYVNTWDKFSKRRKYTGVSADEEDLRRRQKTSGDVASLWAHLLLVINKIKARKLSLKMLMLMMNVDEKIIDQMDLIFHLKTFTSHRVQENESYLKIDEKI